ncbi:MAG: hypothetical protein ACFCBW_10370 [Candidatus Competibacterales bacterium]
MTIHPVGDSKRPAAILAAMLVASAPVMAQQTLYIGNTDGEVAQVSGSFNGNGSFSTGLVGGVELDVLNNLYHAGEGEAGNPLGSVSVVCRVGDRLGGSFDSQRDRRLGGDGEERVTGLSTPVSAVIAHQAGFLIVANKNAPTLTVHGTAAGGIVQPVAQTPLPALPRDLTYDETEDRLFIALSDGTVGVIDDYVFGGFGLADSAISRLIPADVNGTPMATNIQGVAFDPTRDRLVVADLGADESIQGPDFAQDGSLYFFNNARTARGAVNPNIVLRGLTTRLANPSDVVLVDQTVLVADPLTDELTLFDGLNGIFLATTQPFFDRAPDLVNQGASNPLSMVLEGRQPLRPDGTDIENANIAIGSVVVGGNPDLAADPDRTGGFTVRFTSDGSTALTSFAADARVQDLVFDQTGDAYITFDTGAGGGVAVINRLAESRSDGSFTTSRDRLIVGAATQLRQPRGVEIADEPALLLVADAAADLPAVYAFSPCVLGNTAPLGTIDMRGVGQPFAVDSDPITDLLFVALGDGRVAVYDDYSGDLDRSTPSRLIEPTFDGDPITSELRGIDYLASLDRLVLSDIGDEGVAFDGAIVIIDRAGDADGATEVRSVLQDSGALNDPVDIAFDGEDLFVVDRLNQVLARYEDLLTLPTGLVTPSPAVLTTVLNPETVALAPEYLSGIPLRSSVPVEENPQREPAVVRTANVNIDGIACTPGTGIAALNEDVDSCVVALSVRDQDGAPIADVAIGVRGLVAPGAFSTTFTPNQFGPFGITNVDGLVSAVIELRAAGTYQFQITAAGAAAEDVTTVGASTVATLDASVR